MGREHGRGVIEWQVLVNEMQGVEERVIFEVQGEKRHKRSLNARLTISVLMLTKNINLRLRCGIALPRLRHAP